VVPVLNASADDTKQIGKLSNDGKKNDFGKTKY
jgi:hypothetical protein